MAFSIKKAALSLLSFSSLLTKASPTPKKTEIVESASGFQNAVYFVNWGIYARNYKPAQLPVSQISYVLYAFLNLQSDGTVVSGDTWADTDQHYDGDSWNDSGKNVYGCVKQLYLLKKKNRNMKVLLSIGGWTWSQNGNFASAAGSAANRARFAQTSVATMKDWGFDGIDIDWEYPANPSQGHDFVLLLQAVRQELDRYASQHASGYHFLLTAATPAGPQNYASLDLAGMAGQLDFFNLMAYDYAGGWNTTAGHQANLHPSRDNPAATPFSTDRAVADYVAAGVPAGKIVLGMPAYGRAFEGTDGPGKPYSGVGSGSWENGIWDYKVLPRAGATEKYDDESGATYSYDAASRTLVSYDTADMVTRKIGYVKSKGLAGGMFWEASGDRADGKSLIAASKNALGALDSSQNLLSYPDSMYDNLKNGM